MAKSPSKLTKSELLKEMELSLQSLNLLISTLKNEKTPKHESLEDYRRRFYELVNVKKK
ncbi:MAG: hypothetical protein ACOYXT_26410 [Bacteroidota bacterium]